VAYQSQTPAGLHVGLVDVRSGPLPAGLDLPDSLARGVTPVAGGWAWIPASGDRAVVERAGKRVEIAVPRWFDGIFDLSTDAAGSRLAMVGWNTGTNDTLGVAIFSADGGTPVIWVTSYAESGGMHFLADGSVLLRVRPTQESVALLQLRGPGDIKRLGVIPRPVAGVSLSADLKRALIVERNYHGDAWMSRIVRP
jgi:hypothetical protein